MNDIPAPERKDPPAPGKLAGFDFPPSAPKAGRALSVLARKYRPSALSLYREGWVLPSPIPSPAGRIHQAYSPDPVGARRRQDDDRALLARAPFNYSLPGKVD